MNRFQSLILILITALCFIFACVNESNNSAPSKGAIYPKKEAATDWEFDDYQGKVRSCTSFVYKAIVQVDAIITGEKIEGSSSNFDSLGRLTADELYFIFGDSIDYEYHYQYDTAGNPLEEFYGNQRFTAVNKYDSLGNLLECTTFEENGTVDFKFLYRYNSLGQEFENKAYNADGSLYETIIYLYDNQGNLIEKEKEMGAGTFGYRIAFRYDAVGNEIEKTSYRFDGSVEKKSTYQYDTHSNLIESSEDGFHNSFQYNEKGNLVEEIEKEGNQFKFRSLYTYDKQNNLLSTKVFNANNDYFFGARYEYEYDDQGNWTKKTKYNVEDKAEEVTLRSISYY